MLKTTLFTSNRTQAVRLPKAVAFDEGVREVEIIKVGQSRIITPVGERWTDYFQSEPELSADFMDDIQDLVREDREPL